MFNSILPGQRAMTSGIRTRAVVSVPRTVCHLHFMHAVNMKFRIDNRVVRVHYGLMTFAAGHALTANVLAVITRLTSASHRMTGGTNHVSRGNP